MKTKQMRDTLFDSRMGKLLTCINNARYDQSHEIKELFWGECESEETTIVELVDKNVQYEPLKKNFEYSGYDKYWWVKVSGFQVPNWQDQKIVLRILFQKQTDEWDKGTEGLVYLNNKPWQGIDQNHIEIFLPNELAGNDLDLKIRYWTGANNHDLKHHRFYHATISILNEACDKLYYAVKNMIHAIPLLDIGSYEGVCLIKALNEIHTIIDINHITQEQIASAYDIINNTLPTEIASLPLINIVGHTHIDVAWQWRFKHTREKAMRSFSTVLRLMEMYPEYLFLQSTPQLYEYIREDCPPLFNEIKERIGQNRWECEGGMWVEADCNIPSGESLARQFLFGKKYFRQEFNKENKILWLPDVFGYNWALPQLMKKSGIDYFMTTKISWNQYNRMPNETFVWRGMDGSEVLTHFINTPEEGLDPDLFFRTYNGMVTPFTAKKMWEDYTNKELNNTLLNCYGYGDGGGGATRDMLENARIMENLPGIPKVKQSFAKDFFETLEKTVRENKRYLNTWDGELYFELHRGTFTSQALIKKINRKLEYQLRNLEFLLVHKALKVNDFSFFDYNKFNGYYKQFLTNQFHDIIPGTCIKEVYDDVKTFSHNLEIYLNEEYEKLMPIQQKEHTYTVINFSSYPVNNLVYLENNEEGIFYHNGTCLNSSRDCDGYYVNVDVAPFSTIHIEFSPCKRHQGNELFHFSDNTLETPYYTAIFENGIITSLFDKINQRNITAGALGQLVLCEDIPEFWDSWDLELHHKLKQTLLSATKFSVKSCDEMRIIFYVEYCEQGLTLSQEIIFYSCTPLIEFVNNCDWAYHQKLLKVQFDVDIRAKEATYDIQFGNVKRTTSSNTDWEMAQFEYAAHRFADLSDTSYGIAVINDCKYGHSIKNNRIELSLLKASCIL